MICLLPTTWPSHSLTLFHFWHYPLCLELSWPLSELECPGMHKARGLSLADPTVWKHFTEIFLSLSFSFSLPLFLLAFSLPCLLQVYSSVTSLPSGIAKQVICSMSPSPTLLFSLTLITTETQLTLLSCLLAATFTTM